MTPISATLGKSNPKTTARIAGLLYLSLIPLGVFGILYVPNTLFVEGDAAATAHNIIANTSLFRLSIMSALVCQLVNIAVVLLLAKLLQPVSRTLAKLMVLFILLGAPIAMLNELNHMGVLFVLSGSSSLSGFTEQQLHGFAAMLIEMHQQGIQIAAVFWGLWLFPMGVLVYRSKYLPKVIGVLLVIGSLGYLADFLIAFLLPNISFVVSEFTFMGEFAIALWLLVKGVDVANFPSREQASDAGLAARTQEIGMSAGRSKALIPVLLVGALVFSVDAQAKTPSWTTETALDGKVAVKSRIASRNDEQGRQVQLIEWSATALVKAEMATLVSALKDIETHKDFLDETKSSILSQSGDNRWVAYYYYDTPWPFTDFDYVMNVEFDEDKANKTARMRQVSAPKKHEVTEGVDRAAHFLVTYFLRDKGNGYVEFTMSSKSTPSSEVPEFLIRTNFPDGPATTIQRFVKHTGTSLGG
jgi:hypothetical protein